MWVASGVSITPLRHTGTLQQPLEEVGQVHPVQRLVLPSDVRHRANQLENRCPAQISTSGHDNPLQPDLWIMHEPAESAHPPTAVSGPDCSR